MLILILLSSICSNLHLKVGNLKSCSCGYFPSPILSNHHSGTRVLLGFWETPPRSVQVEKAVAVHDTKYHLPRLAVAKQLEFPHAEVMGCKPYANLRKGTWKLDLLDVLDYESSKVVDYVVESVIELNRLLIERSLWNAYRSSTVFCMTRVLDVHLTSSLYTKERYYNEESRST